MIGSLIAILFIGAIIWFVLELSIILICGLFIVAAFSSHTEAGNTIGVLGLIFSCYMLANN
jgi:hypothetical protein